jgi:hypothetical protein
MNVKLTIAKSARGGAWGLRSLATIYLRLTEYSASPYFILRSLLGQQYSGEQSSEFRVSFVEDIENILITVCSITVTWIQTDVETCYYRECIHDGLFSVVA